MKMSLTFELMPTILYLFWVLIMIRRKKKSLLFIPQIHPKIKGVINKDGTVKLERSAARDSLWSWDSWVGDEFDFQITFSFEGGEEEANGGRCNPDFLTWCVAGLGAIVLLCTTRTEESLLSKAFGRNHKTEVDTSVLQIDAPVESETELGNIPALNETDDDGSIISQY
ncbi:hypothetical protein J437_LFUL002645 [Ladona fulva]|uniref:Uncharacterized protein n=1 Tax=Ladona fulva TaxID=123851 RepID=A0A8K0JWY2_LADFU|nr:hypothetical protein J437_LFUL002645 [Ladona fulva]